MNYRDLQNISNLSQQILVEGAKEEHNVLNRWPYTSPYLQESTEVVEEKKPLPVGKMDAKAKELKSKFHKSKVGTPEASKLLSRLGHIVAARDSKVVSDSYDLYDIILTHLLDEGYADTQEAAEAIMVNMSEDWRESIVEQASTVASSGGAGGKVTADKQYPATLRGLKGVKSTDSNGTEYFQPYTSSGRKEPSGKPFEPTTMPDANRAQYKQLYSGKYENIPASQSTKNPESHLFRTGVPRVNRGTATYGID